MSKYQPYPQYKDSGVEWLGEVPGHWSIFQIKRSIDGCSNGIWGEEPNGINDLIVIRVADFNRDNFTISEEKLTYRAIEEKDRCNRLLKQNDLLIEKSGGGENQLVGTVVSFNKDFLAVTSNFVAKMTCRKDFNPRYLTYSFAHLYAKRVNFMSIKQTTGIQNLDSNQYLSEYWSFPSLLEQQSIANFLDNATCKIDTLIQKQQNLIELLKEKRQALISHAVTKGLNPHVKMKDSGVEWLGEVPEHWEVKKTKQLFSLIVEPAPNDNDEELLSIYTDIGVKPRKDLEQKGNKATTTDGYWKVKVKDIIVNKLLAWMGAIGISEYDGVTSPAYDILRAKGNIYPEFYHNLFRTKIAQNEFKRWSRGIMEMRLRLYFSEFGQIPMPVPSFNEQIDIVNYIVVQTTKIDTLISKAEKAIELLKERRTALISETVTGKIDVRGIAS